MSTTTTTFYAVLDGSSKKYLCPTCGKRTFNRMRGRGDKKKGPLLPDHFGKCERINNCSGSAINAPSFSEVNAFQAAIGDTDLFGTPVSYQRQRDPVLTYLPEMYLRESLCYRKKTTFFQYLSSVLGYALASAVTAKYMIGGRTNGAVEFFEIEPIAYEGRNFRVCYSAILHYDALSGRRKKGQQFMSNGHKQSRTPANDGYDHVFFGQHLVGHPIHDPRGDKKIAIVESQKTAIILSAIMPEYLWLATTSLTALSTESELARRKLELIKDRSVVLFPDYRAYRYWSDYAKKWAVMLRTDGEDMDISCSDYLSERVSPSLLDQHSDPDIWDYFDQNFSLNAYLRRSFLADPFAFLFGDIYDEFEPTTFLTDAELSKRLATLRTIGLFIPDYQLRKLKHGGRGVQSGYFKPENN